MKQNYFIAVLCSLFANLNFSIINVIVSKMPYEIHAMRIFFFQMLFSSVFLFPWIFRKGLSVFKTSQLKLHAMRGAVSIVSVFFFYTSLRLLSSVDAVLVKSTSPFIVPILAIFWLKEKVPRITWPLVTVGFIGVFLVIGPFNSSFTFVHFFPLLAAVGYGYMIVSISKLRKTESIEQVLLYYNLTALLFLSPLILLTWNAMPLALWGILLLMGLFFALGQIAIVGAYSYSLPGRLAPFIFSEVFFTYLIVHLYYGVTLSTRDMIGAMLIVSSALLMLWVNRKEKMVPTE